MQTPTPSTTTPTAPPFTLKLRVPPTETELCSAACVASHPHCAAGNAALDGLSDALVALASLAPEGSQFAQRLTALEELLGEIGSAFESLSIILHERRVDLLITAPAESASPTGNEGASEQATAAGFDVFDLLGHFLGAALEGTGEPPQFTEEERRRVLTVCIALGGRPQEVIRDALLARYSGGEAVGL
jgi:hypothetical protein